MSGIWGSSPKDVYAVGWAGYPIWRYDGTKWSNIPSTFQRFNREGSDIASPSAVYGFGPNNVWVAGTYIRKRGGQYTYLSMLLHYDGAQWKEHDIDGPALSDLWGSSPNDIFAVGETGTVLHYDGTAWNKYQTDTTINLYRVHGKNDEVYALGQDRYRIGVRAILVRLFPSGFAVVDSQQIVPTSSLRFGVSGLYVPQEGIIYTSNPDIYKRVNTVWQQVLSKDTHNFTALSGSGPNNIFANYYHWNGTNWEAFEEILRFLPTNPSDFSFRSVWTNGQEVFLCGTLYGNIEGTKSLIIHGK
jgi:hypothetical protein